jgi:hypothetical protein
MDHRDQLGLPASLVNGRLEGFSVPDLLWNLCRRRCTGVLHLTANRITKRVYIDSGKIVFALSGDPTDRLGDLLLREGQITLDQMEAAIGKLTTGKRMGTILVDAGHLTPDNLVRGVLSQVKGMVLGLFPWEEGEYSFVEGPLPTDEVVTLGMRTAEILLQGIRQIRSFTRIRKSVGPPSTRYRLESDWKKVLDGLDIRDGERMLLQRLEQAGARGLSVDAMCREIFLSNFEIYQALWAFLVLGVLAEVDGVAEASAGRAERATLPSVLVRLAQEEATGVLRMSRGTLERTLHIKQGQCIFATSNSVDDGLVAHLLRRGVISLADREETARRLLSNKRVGTILLEMGVIDESDLRASVREQLSEIVFDTFRWEHGDFHFVEGDLPTIEEITLTRTIEDLIFAGVRRITSWQRVKEGCGGLGARLVLQPEYLSVLDKMTVGPEEWELISVLKTPKTVLEICRESVLGDFRSCQILWALRLLGGVGEAPLEVSLDTALGVFEGQSTPPTAAASGLSASAPVQPEPEPEATPAATLRALPASVPLSDADETAEVISEPWRLAAERPPEVPREAPTESFTETSDEQPTEAPVETAADAFAIEMPSDEGLPAETTPDPESSVDEPAMEEPATPAFELDSPADATVMMSRDEVESALRAPADVLPAFELGAPGTGLEDMKVDMRPAAIESFERATHEEVAAEQAPPETMPELEETADLDRTVRMSREDVEAALHAPTPEPPPAPAVPMFEMPEPAPIPPPSPAFEMAALPPAPEPVRPAPMPEAPIAAWEPPAGLDGIIASFNARHVVLFRAMRAEIGAGAANFVRSCRAALDSRFAEMFASAELRADGSWDPEQLRRAVIDHRLDDAGDGFAKLLEGEMARLRAHVGEKRAAGLADQLSAIP